MQKRTQFAILDEIAHHKKILKELETELKDKNNVEVTGESPIQPTTKRLKISFWKAERALSMQILEQEGLPGKTVTGVVKITTSPDLWDDFIFLRGTSTECDYAVICKHFTSNQKRDEYLDKITKAITDELFTSNSELKVGEMCEVRDFEYEEWKTRKLLAILPKNYIIRFIVEIDEVKDDWVDFRQARPLSKRIEPKVETNGEIITYTWEE